MKAGKVLVIDDEKIVLNSVRKILTPENFDVDIELKGLKGIEMAVKGSYDIVLTDIRMPDVGGLIVLRDVKRAKPSLPVVIITGFGTVRSAIEAMRLGASDYLEKPFTPEQLIETVRKAIEKAAMTEPEEQKIIHPEEVLRVLERAAADGNFRHKILEEGSLALSEYILTSPEKLALITGDIPWIEEQIGPLTDRQKEWLVARLSAEIW